MEKLWVFILFTSEKKKTQQKHKKQKKTKTKKNNIRNKKKTKKNKKKNSPLTKKKTTKKPYQTNKKNQYFKRLLINLMRILRHCGGVNTTIWMHYIDAN